jgi:osmotically-inducible protein OsmY
MDTQMSSVSKQINDALLNDPRTKKSVIDVAFSQGMVTLTGTVKSVDVIKAAEEIARAQPDVLMVTNELKVK